MRCVGCSSGRCRPVQTFEVLSEQQSNRLHRPLGTDKLRWKWPANRSAKSTFCLLGWPAGNWWCICAAGRSTYSALQLLCVRPSRQVVVEVAGKQKRTAEAAGEAAERSEETLEFLIGGNVADRPGVAVHVEVWDNTFVADDNVNRFFRRYRNVPVSTCSVARVWRTSTGWTITCVVDVAVTLPRGRH